MPTIQVIWGGEVCSSIAADLVAQGSSRSPPVLMESVSMETFKRPDLAAFADADRTAVFLVQTVENGELPEAAGGFLRFFKRKNHPADMLAGKLSFAVLAVGDSNLLLDRQTTKAKDCNQAGQALDSRLPELGASRFYGRGEADERTGMEELEEWIEGLWPAIEGIA